MSPVGPRLLTRRAPVHGSYRTNTGKDILALSISAHDPSPTSVALRFRNARAHESVSSSSRARFRIYGLPVSLLSLDICGLDDRPPFFDFGLVIRSERRRRQLIGRRNFLSGISQPSANSWVGQR